MKIKQIRQGFANNSSSSHSIIWVKDIDSVSSDDYNCDYGFGWDAFTAADEYSKEKYLFSSLIANFNERLIASKQFYGKRSIGNINDAGLQFPFVIKNGKKFQLHFGWYRDSENRFNAVVKPYLYQFKDSFSNFDSFLNQCETDADSFSVDHQSLLCFPIDSKTGFIHIDFAKEFIKFIVKENFVILGGNDNGGDDHHYSSYNDGHKLLSFISNITDNGNNMVVVRDDANEDYVLQLKSRGTVFRVSFSNDEETKKSSIPTLVDISITSYCDKGCKFCYQSSSINGKHADKYRVFEILSSLKNAGTLEIVIGGGEPTSHPDFVEILKYAEDLGLTVSFTTRNYKLDEHKDIVTILGCTNSIAFSCNTVDDVEAVSQYRRRLDARHIWNHPNMTIQNILGLDDLFGLETFLNKCSDSWHTTNISLLGYKDFGFGKNHEPKNIDGWIDVAKKFTNIENDDDEDDKYNLSFGIDSIVVKKYKDDLISSGVDYRTLVAEEGKFSCYIDAVKNTIASSSFTNTTHELNQNWLEIYKTF